MESPTTSISTATNENVSLQEHLSKYSSMVENILRPQLVEAEKQSQLLEEEIRDYQDLFQRLQQQKEERQQQQTSDITTNNNTSMMVDLGYQTIFCQCTISNPSKLFVHVGMGFHIEMTVEEAQDFCQKRVQHLKLMRLPPLQVKMLELQQHLQSATTLMQQLQQELQ